MKHLLIVTDHRYYAYNGEIYDNYVFDYKFFKDYLSVFEKVTIVARAEVLDNLPDNFMKTTGENLSFITVNDTHGSRWITHNSKLLKASGLNLLDYDAICYRIPSILSFSVWKLNRSLGRPQMFEFIGHPKESLQFSTKSVFKKILLKIIGNKLHSQCLQIVKSSLCGSYVTMNSLQTEYPIANKNNSESISSIRLDKRHILETISPLDLKKIKIIHVGSFVPVKNQKLLIEFGEVLKELKFDFTITFLGGGNLLDSHKELVQQKGLKDNIAFKGHIVGFESIVKELDASNIFILPSFSEGMPRALLEAMARGLICFGSNRGGTAEILNKEYLFDPNSLDSLKNTFLNLLNEESKLYGDCLANLEKLNGFESKTLEKKRRRILEILKNEKNEINLYPTAV